LRRRGSLEGRRRSFLNDRRLFASRQRHYRFGGGFFDDLYRFSDRRGSRGFGLLGDFRHGRWRGLDDFGQHFRRGRYCWSLRFDDLDETRGPKRWRRRLGRLRFLRHRRLLATLGWRRGVREHVTTRQRDAALTSKPLYEGACDNFLE
jgi:hypothetical protein